MTEHEYDLLESTSSKEYELIQHDYKGVAVPETLKFSLCENISVGQLKSFLLTKTENKAFYMEHFVNNTDTLKNLQAKKESGQDKINVYHIANYANRDENKNREEDKFSLKVQCKKEN